MLFPSKPSCSERLGCDRERPLGTPVCVTWPISQTLALPLGREETHLSNPSFCCFSQLSLGKTEDFIFATDHFYEPTKGLETPALSFIND